MYVRAVVWGVAVVSASEVREVGLDSVLASLASSQPAEYCKTRL